MGVWEHRCQTQCGPEQEEQPAKDLEHLLLQQDVSGQRVDFRDRKIGIQGLNSVPNEGVYVNGSPAVRMTMLVKKNAP